MDYATFAQGMTAGLSMTGIAFLATRSSLTTAGLFSGSVALGMMLSSYLKRLSPRSISALMTLARAAGLLAAFAGVFPLVHLFAVVTGASSRRIFLELKHQVAELEASHLVKHGSWNAIGFGLGAASAGLLLSHPLMMQIVAGLIAIAAFMISPSKVTADESRKTGLIRRDIFASIIFSFASNPLTNATAPIILAGLVGEKTAGFSALAYTCGAVAAPFLAQLATNLRKPVAAMTAAASLTFAAVLVAPWWPVALLMRFLCGALLFAAQGILELRSQRDGGGYGLDHLWTYLSAASILGNFLVPYAVGHTDRWLVPIWTLVGAILISQLVKVRRLHQ